MMKLLFSRNLVVIAILIYGGFIENAKCLAASENNALSYQVINYNSWYSGNYQMRVYKGTKTALLIPDEWFANLVPEQNAINLYGEWKGISDQAIAFTLSWLDKGYDFYYSFTGQAPANSAITPGYIPIAFVDSSCGAGCGLIGGAGIEIGKAYFVYQVYSAGLGEMIQTIFWHELGRNFSVGTGSTNFDVGVKYVLVNELNVPTNMNGEYGVLYEQFLLDQSYLLPRYYMADSKSSIDGLDGGASKPSIPDNLLSSSLMWHYNGGDIRSGWAYQFYLENGFSKWKDLAKYIFNNNLGSNNSEIILKVKDKMNELSQFDYSYITKNGWSYTYDISSYVGGIFNINSSAKGSGIETGYGDDTVNIFGYGQFRVDTGDGYDTVSINGLGNKYKISQLGWNATLVDEATSTFVSLNFVEKLVVNGVTYELSNKYSNTLPPIVKYIESTTGGLKIKNGDDLVVGFTEPVHFEGDCKGEVTVIRDESSGIGVDYKYLREGSSVVSGDVYVLKNIQGIEAGKKYKIWPTCGWFFDSFHNMIDPIAYWRTGLGPYASYTFTGAEPPLFQLTTTKSGSGVITSSSGKINCGTMCSSSYSYGASETLTANPSAGYQFDGWSGACSGKSPCTLTLNSSQSVNASFSLVPVYYSLSVTNAGSGSLLSDPQGILCSGSCSATYLSGTLVTLYPTPVSGSYFTGWSGACTGLGSCTVNMTGNQLVTANYSAIPAGSSLLSVNKSGKGVVTSSPAGITCGAVCSYPYANNTLVTLYPTPDPGNTFTGWAGACEGKSSCMVMMSLNQNVTATFKNNYLMILPILNDYLNR